VALFVDLSKRDFVFNKFIHTCMGLASIGLVSFFIFFLQKLHCVCLFDKIIYASLCLVNICVPGASSKRSVDVKTATVGSSSPSSLQSIPAPIRGGLGAPGGITPQQYLDIVMGKKPVSSVSTLTQHLSINKQSSPLVSVAGNNWRNFTLFTLVDISLKLNTLFTFICIYLKINVSYVYKYSNEDILYCYSLLWLST